MTVRFFSMIALATTILAGGLVQTAEAATRHTARHAVVRHTTRATAHTTRMRATRTSMRSTGRVTRGGDAQNGAVDRLNQQSLDSARSGTPAPQPAAQ